jgi:AGCS family alanine or glycine:cation symporter
MSSRAHQQRDRAGFAGATMKEAIRYGVARGLFSNESGLGSAPIVSAATQPKIRCARRSARFRHYQLSGPWPT